MIAVARDFKTEEYDEPQASEASEPAWHAPFLALLPQVHDRLRFAFRKLPPEERLEATCEAIASIAISFARLYEQGKSAVAYASTLAEYAVRHYFAGRRVGSRLNADDITSPYAQRQRGYRVRSLDRRDPSGAWKEIVVEDRRATPADVAASRIDLEDWFDQLPRLKRGVAQTLATGESTKETASRFNVTPGRVSQMRGELAEDWADFQGQTLAVA